MSRQKGPMFGFVMFLLLALAAVLFGAVFYGEELNHLITWVFSNH